MSVITVMTYIDYKTTLDMEMSKVADGVVKIGYLLKVARDTDILSDSGYKTVAEFAEAEYGMRKDAVSRYIAINDRYSLDGYSDELDTKYRGYGATKLSEMLTLPDTIIESITPDFTKEDIRAIKKEYTEEAKISKMEVMLEDKREFIKEDDGVLQQVMREYGYENPEKFMKLREASRIGATAGRIMDVLAPAGYGVVTVRIPGKGKYMVTLTSKDANVEVLSVRENEKSAYTWGEMISAVIKTVSVYAENDKRAWEEVYQESYREPVAPAQPEKKQVVEPSKKIVKQEPKKSTEPKRISEPKKIGEPKVLVEPKEQEVSVDKAILDQDLGDRIEVIAKEDISVERVDPIAEAMKTCKDIMAAIDIRDWTAAGDLISDLAGHIENASEIESV